MQHVHPVDPYHRGPLAAPTRRARRRAELVAPVAALSLLLAACGSGSEEEAAQDTPAASSDERRRPEGVDRPGGGVSGEVAAVDGTTMQVQDDDAQTAVTWTDATTFTQNVDATLADVAPGVCVQVVAAPGEDAQGAPASSVAISDPVDGTCAAGFGGPGGELPQPPDGELPEDVPTDRPTDLPEPGERPEDAPTEAPEGVPAGGFAGFGTSGLVSAVDGTTLTVEVTSRDGSTSTASVTVDDATTYTRTASTDASVVAVGRCALVRGEADDSGAVTATSVMVSPPGDDGCALAAGPGVRGPGGPGGSDGEGGPAPRQDDEGTASDDA